MIKNKIYRHALEKIIPDIVIKDGCVLVTGASGLIGSCLIDLLMLANNYGRHFDVYALGRNKNKLKNRLSALYLGNNCNSYHACLSTDDNLYT